MNTESLEIGILIPAFLAGMLVLATHRLFRGLSPMSSGQLREALGDCFSAEPAGSGRA